MRRWSREQVVADSGFRGQFGGSLHSSADSRVTAATTKDAGQRLVHGVIIRRGIPRQEGSYGQDHGRGAVAALRGTNVDECLLHRMQPATDSETLDSRDAASCDSGYRLAASPNGLVVNEDRAGTARPFSTSRLGTRETEVFSQSRQQVRCWPHRARRSIDDQRGGHGRFDDGR